MKTPLRYPGGKQKFFPIFRDFIQENNIRDAIFIEPYCGGAGASIKLLLSKTVKEIHLNDIDKSIYAFWWCVLNEKEKFIRKIQRTPISVEEFYRQKEVQKKKEDNLFKLGFSTFYINRTSFSGILNGGPIGGVEQKSPYTIGCRFNKEALIQRIEDIHRYKKRIHIYTMDAKDFLQLKTIEKLPKHKVIIYADPPYFVKGSELYLNTYTLQDHEKMEKFFNKSKWRIFVSYDDVREIRDIYNEGWEKDPLDVNHFAGIYKMGKEVLFSKT